MSPSAGRSTAIAGPWAAILVDDYGRCRDFEQGIWADSVRILVVRGSALPVDTGAGDYRMPSDCDLSDILYRVGIELMHEDDVLPQRWEQAQAVAQALNLLAADVPQHLMEIRVDGWTLQHPLACRPNLWDCEVNRAMDARDIPAGLRPAVYVCELVDGELTIGDQVEAIGGR